MAEGFAWSHGGEDVEIKSGGTSALGYVHPATIRAMSEVGINISDQTSDQVTKDIIEWADIVITLGCCTADEICPPSYKGEKQDWPIEDPFGRDDAFMRHVRDDIEKRVVALLAPYALKYDGGGAGTADEDR